MGYASEGYPPEGYPPENYSPKGYPPEGYPPEDYFTLPRIILPRVTLPRVISPPPGPLPSTPEPPPAPLRPLVDPIKSSINIGDITGDITKPVTSPVVRSALTLIVLPSCGSLRNSALQKLYTIRTNCPLPAGTQQEASQNKTNTVFDDVQRPSANWKVTGRI